MCKKNIILDVSNLKRKCKNVRRRIEIDNIATRSYVVGLIKTLKIYMLLTLWSIEKNNYNFILNKLVVWYFAFHVNFQVIDGVDNHMLIEFTVINKVVISITGCFIWGGEWYSFVSCLSCTPAPANTFFTNHWNAVMVHARVESKDCTGLWAVLWSIIVSLTHSPA